MSDNLLTIWIAERNDLAYRILRCEEESIRASLQIKLDRVNRKIDEVVDPSHKASYD